MIKKYLWTLLICLFGLGVMVPQIANSNSHLCEYHAQSYEGLEMAELAQELNSTGLIGRIHGAAAESHLFVMSVREPHNFFNHREFSLIPKDPASIKMLKQANRHDLVCVQGDFISNPSPQHHIALESVQILDPWLQSSALKPYERQSNLPAEIKEQTSLVGKVHAIGENGKVLVVGYKDLVIPIFVSATEFTQGLYRGDIIKLHYQLQPIPNQPVHLQLDSTVDEPIQVLDAIADWHGQAKTFRGKLVKFPQSPQLKFDVYAIEVETLDIKRYFTLINFDDIAKFEQIRQKLAGIWDKNELGAVAGRNMLINPQIVLEAQGIGNIISTAQANPQILLDSAEQVRQLDLVDASASAQQK